MNMQPMTDENYVSPDMKLFTETCPKCRGSGMFRGYTGRVLGKCHACKGAGSKTFKQSATARAATREKAAARKERLAEQNEIAFAVDQPEVWRWIMANPSFGFAASMREAVRKYETLTEGQLAAVWKCIDKQAERDKARAEAAVQREAAAKPLDTAALEAAFDKAGGGANLKLRFAGFAVYPARQHPGTLYVKDGGLYLGKITGGRFFQSRDCTPELEERFREVCVDPKAAAVRYGRETGCCSVCGRELTNKGSIEAGIGPICAGKFF